jgi:hypothetical protein
MESCQRRGPGSGAYPRPSLSFTAKTTTRYRAKIPSVHYSDNAPSRAHPARGSPEAPARARESPQRQGRKSLLSPGIPAYPRSARKRQDWPVKPEVAGSSPVAPVHPRESGPRCARAMMTREDSPPDDATAVSRARACRARRRIAPVLRARSGLVAQRPRPRHRSSEGFEHCVSRALAGLPPLFQALAWIGWPRRFSVLRPPAVCSCCTPPSITSRPARVFTASAQVDYPLAGIHDCTERSLRRTDR